MKQAMQYDVSAIVNDGNAAYHSFLRRGDLRMQCCSECGYVRYPSRPDCPECLSAGFEWKRLDGAGILEAFVWYLNDAYDAAYDSAWAWREVPYNVALVKLDGGPTVLSNVMNASFGVLKPGQTVKPLFVPISDEYGILRFTPTRRHRPENDLRPKWGSASSSSARTLPPGLSTKARYSESL